MYKHFKKDPNGEEKKLTDEEIVKAYKSCFIDRADCDTCPCDDWGCGVDGSDILNLINRQKQTIAEYERKLADGDLISKEWHDEQVFLLVEENELLKSEIEKECQEHIEFARLAKKADEQQKAEMELLSKVIASSKRKAKILEMQKEIEQLTEAETELQELNAKYYNEAKDLRRENTELQKQVDELKAKNKSLGLKALTLSSENKMLVDICNDCDTVKQAVKDTAKEIYEKVRPLVIMKNEKFTNGDPLIAETNKWFRNKFNDIFKPYGVEVE